MFGNQNNGIVAVRGQATRVLFGTEGGILVPAMEAMCTWATSHVGVTPKLAVLTLPVTSQHPTGWENQIGASESYVAVSPSGIHARLDILPGRKHNLAHSQ